VGWLKTPEQVDASVAIAEQFPFYFAPHHTLAVFLRLEQQHCARQRTRNSRQRHCRTLPESLPQVHVRGAASFVLQNLFNPPFSALKKINILCMYVEQSYFARWWRLQPQHTRALVRGLVDSGQLSFSNGGWCMHDEATPHYADMIDQMTLG
jgi:hypothetical protein